jgi:hypothetical protein
MRFKSTATIAFVALTLLISSCKAGMYSSNGLLQELDKYCTAKGQESLDKTQSYSRVESFFSPSLKTCVRVEVQSDDVEWRYEILDITHGFFNPPRLVKHSHPLDVTHTESGRNSYASTDGYWKATDGSHGKKFDSNVAVKLSCDHGELLCKESQASIFAGVIQADLVEYKVSSWTADGVVAENDDDDSSKCPLGHRLTIDFKSNSVIEVDSLKTAKPECEGVSRADSYTLLGGRAEIAGWDSVFYCGKDGINNAVTSKVIALNGDVIEHPYSDYMDDGSGGPPAHNEAPAHPVTQTDCQNALDKKLKELHGD